MLLPRTLLAVALLLLGGQGAVLAIWGQTPPGPAASNAFQLAVGGLCMLATALASRQGSTFERRFVGLVASRYVFWGTAQSLATYYAHVGNITFQGSLADVLFHLEDLPLGIALFMDPHQAGDRTPRLRPLDLAQLVIFWGALYFYVHHMVTARGSGLVAATDALVGGSFFLRALTARSSMTSAMVGRWTPAILLSTVNDAYAGHYDSEPGGPFDLVWSSEMLVWMLTAVTWRPVVGERLAAARASVERTLHLLPLVVAGFTVVVAVGVAPARPLGVQRAGVTGVRPGGRRGRRGRWCRRG